MSEQEKPAVEGVPVMDCGHVDSFEHRLVQGILTIVEIGVANKVDPFDACIEFVKHTFEQLYIPTPTIEEINKIVLSKHMTTKEVQ